jgi:hypothetical protein
MSLEYLTHLVPSFSQPGGRTDFKSCFTGVVFYINFRLAKLMPVQRVFVWRKTVSKCASVGHCDLLSANHGRMRWPDLAFHYCDNAADEWLLLVWWGLPVLWNGNKSQQKHPNAPRRGQNSIYLITPLSRNLLNNASGM